MLSETNFHTVSDTTLVQLQESLEAAYERGEIEDLDLNSGVLTIITASTKTFVVSKHAPSQQLWLASPFSGGLHFSYDGNRWLLRDDQDLYTVLSRDLAAAGVTVSL